MDSIADIILKHDGYIWGEYVWCKVRSETSTSIQCRFVSKSLFGLSDSLVIPKHFLIDLNQQFRIKTIHKNSITLENGKKIDIFIHSAGDELDFMRNTDFTCNLLDYRRDGYLVRDSPSVIEYEVSPYETVISHIKEKKLVPVNIKNALHHAEQYTRNGWKSDTFKISDTSGICSICHEEMCDTVCYTAPCGHVHHTKCISQWFEKNPTCPLCREDSI